MTAAVAISALVLIDLTMGRGKQTSHRVDDIDGVMAEDARSAITSGGMMAHTSRRVGLILMVLGVGGYFLSDMASLTALIPALFGFIISALGFYGRHEHTRKTAMHLAMVVALIGILGSARGLMGLPAMLTGGDVERPVAVISQSVMAVVLLVYLVMGIQSFRAARR